MKKIKEILKNNIKLILGIAIGIVIPIASAYAATIYYQGSNVGYNNSTTGLTSTNVQGALDELYILSQNTSIDSDSIDFSSLNTNTTKSVLASSKGVCINRNNKLNCFKINNLAEEQNHIQQVFSDGSCNVGSSGVNCYASDFDCLVYSDGRVDCLDQSDNSGCAVDTDGSVSCS